MSDMNQYQQNPQHNPPYQQPPQQGWGNNPPPGYPPQQPMGYGQGGYERPRKVGGVMIIIGAILLLLGVVIAIAGIAFGGMSVASFGEKIQAFPAPGSIDYTVEDTGSYRIYKETGTNNGGTSTPVGLDVAVTAPDGSDVSVGTPLATEEYAFGSQAGFAIYTFEANQTGDYRVEATIGEGATGTNLSVGPSIEGMFAGIGGIFGGLCGGGLLAILGLILLIVGIVRRGRS